MQGSKVEGCLASCLSLCSSLHPDCDPGHVMPICHVKIRVAALRFFPGVNMAQSGSPFPLTWAWDAELQQHVGAKRRHHPTNHLHSHARGLGETPPGQLARDW